MKLVLILQSLLFFACTQLVVAEELKGPTLSGASNFGHHWNAKTFSLSRKVPVLDFRDTIYWKRVERVENLFQFDKSTTNYPDKVKNIDAEMSLTVNWGNPRYDGGDTPYSNKAVQAFGRFAAEAVKRFPSIKYVEVGNEFNGQNFVKGKVKEQGLRERAAAHFALLKSVHQQVKSEDPDVKILGGATHSLPGAYLSMLFEMGAGTYMDGLAIHPYTTRPEQLKRQIDYLRSQIPELSRTPLHVTEFGEPNPEKASGHFLKKYCAMALSGVERAAWYPMNERGDGFVPLFEKTGQLTNVGRAYQIAQKHFAGKPVRDVSPDPFTYACQFDQTAVVIWGEPREFELLADGFQVLDANGEPLDSKDVIISFDHPIILISESPFELGEVLTLSKQKLVADSYHQFQFITSADGRGTADAFERFALRSGEKIALRTFDGQQRKGVLWVPHLGSEKLGRSRLSAQNFALTSSPNRQLEIVHIYTAPSNQAVKIDAEIEVKSGTPEGARLQLFHNDELVDEGSKSGNKIAIKTEGVELAIGDRLDFRIVRTKGIATVAGRYRFKLATVP
ncbi:MAG: glycosyl hydrolase [Pseudomonadota bacterium]